MWDSRQLRTVAGGIIVEFEQRDCQEFHVLGDAENFCIAQYDQPSHCLLDEAWTRTALRQLNKIQLLALLRSSHMSRVEWIHERFEVGPPPLSERVCNLPLVIDTLARELGPRRR